MRKIFFFSAVDQKSEVGSIEVLIPGNTFELRLDQQLIQKTRLWFNCKIRFRFEKNLNFIKIFHQSGLNEQLVILVGQVDRSFWSSMRSYDSYSG